MNIRRLAAVAVTGLVGGALALAGTAHADHESPIGGASCGADHEGTAHEGYVCEARGDDDQPRWYPFVLAEEGPITVTQASCDDGGKITVAIEDGHPFAVSSETRTAGLAARVGDTLVYQEPVKEHANGAHTTDGDSIKIGPFEADVVLEFRWFAGPDRNDLPAWDATGPADGGWDDVVAEVVSREEAEDRFWDARDDADFVNWYEVNVKGCPADEPDPKPTESPSPEPTTEPTTEPTEEPTTEPKPDLPDTSGLTALPFFTVIGAALLIAGGVAMVAARRRHAVE